MHTSVIWLFGGFCCWSGCFRHSGCVTIWLEINSNADETTITATIGLEQLKILVNRNILQNLLDVDACTRATSGKSKVRLCLQ
jgi:hypothetical protein